MTRGRLLVVEDDPSLLEGIRAILELEGYTVDSAENGVNALEKLRSASTLPDLIVSDIMMPYMDGLQLLQKVRDEPLWTALPFIFLTAKNEKTDIQRGKRLGVDDYLIKPFDAEDLLVAVESRLQRHDKLRQAQDETIGKLKHNILTILNHEFRTPLTFVVAYADMLNTHNAAAMTDNDLVSFLRGVGTGANRLRRLIENFIMLVELETGDAAKTYAWRREALTDYENLLRAAWERVTLAENLSRPLTVEVAENLPPATFDREYMQVALSQLISNAAKFSDKDSPITLGAYEKDGMVCLYVRDHGRGIEKSELDLIWELFYQTDRTVKEDQGTGAGLPIVRGIMGMHQGRCTVQSEPGQGSTFTLMLPL
jgi:two-component system, sensor histidine kinase and response regulator